MLSINPSRTSVVAAAQPPAQPAPTRDITDFKRLARSAAGAAVGLTTGAACGALAQPLGAVSAIRVGEMIAVGGPALAFLGGLGVAKDNHISMWAAIPICSVGSLVMVPLGAMFSAGGIACLIASPLLMPAAAVTVGAVGAVAGALYGRQIGQA